MDAKPTQYIKITHPHKERDGVPQGSVPSPTLFNIYTADIPPPRAPVQVMAYADAITITSTHTSTSAAKKYLQPYLHKVFVWKNTFKKSHTKSRQNNLHSFHVEYKSNLDLKINNTALPMAMHTKILSLTLNPKFTSSMPIHNISVQAHTPLQMIKIVKAT